jgi:carboxylesterase type B
MTFRKIGFTIVARIFCGSRALVRRVEPNYFGSSCMQGPNTPFGLWTKEFIYVTPASEDCLFLNIWTPKTAASAKLPA